MEVRILNGTKFVEGRLINDEGFAALSLDRLRILKLLAKEAMYPAQIAKALKQQVQTTYYHIRALERAGLIKLIEYEEREGGVAKKFAASSNAFAIVLNEGWKNAAIAQRPRPPLLLQPFIKNGTLEAMVVVSSPDSHGVFRGRGCEYSVGDFGLIIGRYAECRQPFFILDTQVKEAHKKENLILIGGLKTNVLTWEVNGLLPIYFDRETHNIASRLSGKAYPPDDCIGLIEVVESPFAKGRQMLVLAGRGHAGTRASVLSLLLKPEQVSCGNSYASDVIAHVVEGFDDDCDGIIDNVEILE